MSIKVEKFITDIGNLYSESMNRVCYFSCFVYFNVNKMNLFPYIDELSPFICAGEEVCR